MKSTTGQRDKREKGLHLKHLPIQNNQIQRETEMKRNIASRHLKNVFFRKRVPCVHVHYNPQMEGLFNACGLAQR